MIDRLDSGDSEHNRVGQQWVVIYGHGILSSSMKRAGSDEDVCVFTSNLKKGWLRKAVHPARKRVGSVKQ